MEEVRGGLDHRLLDEAPDLGPATLESLSAWIWRRLTDRCPGLARVTVHRFQRRSLQLCGPRRRAPLSMG
jgi:6-pyruvoyltetrahydropterin/6-carboxytetrahydropterin synthase